MLYSVLVQVELSYHYPDASKAATESMAWVKSHLRSQRKIIITKTNRRTPGHEDVFTQYTVGGRDSLTTNTDSSQWRHNEQDGVSNHQPHDCLLNRRSKKTSKTRVTGLCAGYSPVTGEFSAQRASNAENVSIWWRHHVIWFCTAQIYIACLLEQPSILIFKKQFLKLSYVIRHG